MALSDAEVKIVVRAVDEASKALKQAQGGLAGLEKQGDKTSGMFGRLQAGWKNMAVVAGAAGAAIFTAKKAFDFAKEGANLNQLEESFDRMNQTVFHTPDLLDRMRQAVRGTVDDATLMQGILTLTAGTSQEMGQAFAEAAPKLLEIAKASNKLNPALGDTAFLYQSLATGIKRSSPLILDNLGLTIKVGEANEKYAESIGKTVEELTASETQQALLNAALEAGDRLIQQVGGSVDSQADSYAQATVALKNYLDQQKRGIGEAVAYNIGVQDSTARWSDAKNALKDAGVEFEYINDVIGDGRAKLDLWRSAADFERDVLANERGIRRMQYALEATNLGLEAGTKEWHEYVQAQEENRRAQDLIIRGFAENKTQAENLIAKLDAGVISYDDLTNAAGSADDAMRKQAYGSKEAAAAVAMTADELKAAKEAATAATAAWADYDEVIRGVNTSSHDAGKAIKIAAGLTAGAAGQVNDLIKNGITLFNQELDDLGPKMVTWGGRTADQNRLLGDMQDEVDGLNRKIADAQAAPELFGGVDEAAKVIENATDRINELAPAMARLGDITGTAGLITQEATVDFDALNSAFIDNTLATLANAEELERLKGEYPGLSLGIDEARKKSLEFAVAMGELTQEQADAIIREIELKAAIDQVSDAFIGGVLTADQAATALRGVADGTYETVDAAIDALSPIRNLSDGLGTAAGQASTLDGKLRALRTAIDQLPPYKRIEIEMVFSGQAPNDLLSGGGTVGPGAILPPEAIPQLGGVTSPGSPDTGNTGIFEDANFRVPMSGPMAATFAPGDYVMAQKTPIGGTTINIDARGAQRGVGTEIEAAVRRALNDAGQRANSLARRAQ